MKRTAMLIGCLLLSLVLIVPALAQKPNPVTKSLISNLSIFDGEHEKLAEGMRILVNCNQLQNLDLVADPAKNFVVIMKDGKIYKSTIK